MSKIKLNLSLGCNVSGSLKGGEFRWKHIVNESNLIWLDWYWEFYGIFNWHVSFENECSDRGMWVDWRPGCFSIVNYMFDCNLLHNIMEKIKEKNVPGQKCLLAKEKKIQIRTVTRGDEFHTREKQKFFHFTRTKTRPKNKPELWWIVTMQMGLIIERVGHTFNANIHTVEWKVLKCASLKDSQKPYDCECASIYFCWHFAICYTLYAEHHCVVALIEFTSKIHSLHPPTNGFLLLLLLFVWTKASCKTYTAYLKIQSATI